MFTRMPVRSPVKKATAELNEAFPNQAALSRNLQRGLRERLIFVDLASFEATINEVNRGRIKTEGRKTRGGEKTCLCPFLKRKEVREGFESLSSFEGPGTSCSARVRIVLPRPSAAMPIRKRSLSSQCIHLLHQNIAIKWLFYVPQYTKMHIIASDTSKISRGKMPPNPPPPDRLTTLIPHIEVGFK